MSFYNKNKYAINDLRSYLQASDLKAVPLVSYWSIGQWPANQLFLFGEIEQKNN